LEFAADGAERVIGMIILMGARWGQEVFGIVVKRGWYV